MLQSVSWSQYITILLVSTIFYYLFIWVVFFKAKFSFIPSLSNLQSSVHGEDSPDEVLSTAQHVMDELRPLFKAGVNKNELLFALQQQLSKYNKLKLIFH